MLQPDESMAKLWVKKPGGAIRRKEGTGVCSAGSLGLVRVCASVALLRSDSEIANANGLDSHPSGSGGTTSRPARVKVLNIPPANAAHAWLINDVSTSGFCERGMIFPPAGEMGDWIEIVPC